MRLKTLTYIVINYQVRYDSVQIISSVNLENNTLSMQYGFIVVVLDYCFS